MVRKTQGNYISSLSLVTQACPSSHLLLSLELRAPGSGLLASAPYQVIFQKVAVLLPPRSDNKFSFCCLDLSLRCLAPSAECICKLNVQVEGERPGRGAARCGELCQTSSLQVLSPHCPALLLETETQRPRCLAASPHSTRG